MRKTRYDLSIMREAAIKGRADFKSDMAKLEDEMTYTLQRNMLYLLWLRTPEPIKAQIRAKDPEAYEWMETRIEQMKKEAENG